ncbi:TIGR04283 family arsenosugar biosynthesis glycosyltransferase [Maribacter polysaccharolyticus]|uniref:TIGR04283 family arsenosugar biosynthesis glycosyltransferase n=1 Tax=Maribacter polysaccharolyticus TaxID=3020831 RepID=UPI00237F962D|nr:TIGR04283 family arsenosugar biosynthesis glycosyltransferase [Maribacter polysaccharolyticus]MDE3742901.1 TIGR04283 family arsenosugar biosynthesis glycosyltransferase [Maribacter polysaccharolyticus]
MKKSNKTISIIIPVLNEEKHIGKLLVYLKENSTPSQIAEVLVVDGHSSDQTVQIARNAGATVFQAPKGRAKQMNYGAKKAKGDILYFLHADTFPPKDFDGHIISALSQNHRSGCFQMRFDSNSVLLRFFAWFTRYNHKICRGGDQSLFITKELFDRIEGYNEDYWIFEDNEMIGRIYQKTDFKILPHPVETSARKYQKNGVLKLQYHFGVIHLKNFLGAGPEKLHDYYKRKIST